MIVEAGHFALKFALVVSLLHSAITLVSFLKKDLCWRVVRFLPAFVFLLILFAFAALLQAYVTSDFSLANVAQNTHTALPLSYKITALWGNHEGSMLLFVLILAFFTWLLASFNRQNHALLPLTLATQQTIISAFLIFILFTSNPFLRIVPIPLQGADLNPLLQDIGLILHPPLLYFGLVGFSIAFSFSVSALLMKRCEAELGYLIRPWLLFSWSLLTLGISFGSYWAYYELGWGGYWFWDPVENASLMPWLAACALIHCVSVLAKRGALKLWTLLLSIFTFSLSLFGTFLVRADLLISVHNFTSIPERSLALLLIVMFFTGGALLLFALFAPQIETKANFSYLSREGALIFNNIFLSTACASVLIGTLYPMLMEVLWDEKISVGPPFFNMIFSWLLLPILLIMPFGPFLGWKRADIATSFERLGLAFAASLAVIITLVLFHEGRASFSSLSVAVALGLASWLILGALSDLFFSIGIARHPFTTLWRRFLSQPLANYGRCFAHAGVGISLAGIVAVGAFSHETIASLQQGQTLTLKETILRFERIIPSLGANYLEDRLELSLWEEKGKQFIGFLYPSRRFFPARNMETSEVGLLWQGMSQYYVSTGHFDERGGLVVHAWYKSYVLAIWLGGFFMAAGGLLALIDRQKKKEQGCNKHS